MAITYNTYAVHQMVFAFLRALNERFVPQRPASRPVLFSIMKDIPWFEWSYAITEDGKVWSYAKKTWPYTQWGFLKPKVTKFWYYSVSLRLNGKTKWYSSHRLVAITYLENPESKRCINHKNWIRNDNRIENLEWCTYRENQLHAYAVLWRKVSDKQRYKFWLLGKSKAVGIKQITKEWDVVREYESLIEATRITWINNISSCARWRYPSAWWYLWKYN